MINERAVSSTTAQGGAGRRTPLLEEVPGLTSAGFSSAGPAGFYDVSIEESGVVLPADRPLGSVAYPGSDEPVTVEGYLQLSDSQFDC